MSQARTYSHACHPCSATCRAKKRPVSRLPRSLPYQSGRTASTVSIDPSSIAFKSSSRVKPPMASFLAEEDALRFGVVLERSEAELAPETALLDAAERRFEKDAPAAVDREDARLDRARHSQRPADVAREERTGKPVPARIGEPHGLLLVSERNDREKRPEDLLARAARFV